MQDVQKLPRFYPSFGNLAKKKKGKKKGESWMDVRLHAFVCQVENKQNPPERPAESFSDLSLYDPAH